MYSQADKTRDLKFQLSEINRRKQEITIKSHHLERLKSITKDDRELQNLEMQLQELRRRFLDFGLKNF
ncbi:Mv-ORF20 peptide [Maruca vitrata nucleopolyhedrovirus]|uniref:Mv-ORF20 peptide n=1 Tax=Maruca vitrata nucleopolyhedrovirus TaxID=1307954 RepID=A1YR82_9ABAC|nr:Mv-ORF20 peptide [Maruca vitrata nucleopolyhedrovirus]ABL75972.1 Mv-ORF20 peptide [Maruca vitrata nucleopolyhedrovirus]